MVPIGSGMLPNSSMEVLFRVMRPVAEQRLVEKLRAQDEVHPARIASDVIDEFRKILQFEPHAEALRARILAHHFCLLKPRPPTRANAKPFPDEIAGLARKMNC